MGHTVLTRLPKSAKWRRVLEELLSGTSLASDDVSKLAALTVEAAATGFQKAAYDPGLRYTFHLLAQTGVVGREPDWRDHLARAGISLTETSCAFELTTRFQAAIDDHISRHEHPTDISEMAQQAAGEALIEIAAANVPVFEEGIANVDVVVRKLSSAQGFSRLGQLFFGHFTARFVNFYLSRVTSDNVGTDRIPSVAELSRLNNALRAYCEETAEAVIDDCLKWHLHRRSAEDVAPDSTDKLLSDALSELSEMLLSQGADQ